MLHSLTSTLPHFAKIEFKRGLNFVVAEGGLSNDKSGTANSVGKTSLFYLINYLLGGDYKSDVFKDKRFQGAAFTLDATLCGARVKVTRSVDSKKRSVVVVVGAIDNWEEMIGKDFDVTGDVRTFSIEEWKRILGRVLFSLPDVLSEPLTPEYELPTTRGLLNYFSRTKFKNVVQSSEFVSVDSGTLICSYLLGLNWIYEAESIGLKKAEETAVGLERAAAFEEKKYHVADADLVNEMSRLQIRIKKAEEDLDKFSVAAQSDLLLARANQITSDLRNAERRAVAARRRLNIAMQSLRGMEEDPDEVERFYASVNAKLGESVKRTLSEARDFHEQLRRFRVKILKEEIDNCNADLRKAEDEIEDLDQQRINCICEDDDTKSAFSDFQQKQNQLATLREQIADFERVQTLRQHAIEERKKVDSARLKLVAREKPRFADCNNAIMSLTEDFKDSLVSIYDSSANPELAIEFLDGTQKGKKSYAIRIKTKMSEDGGQGKRTVETDVFDLLLFARSTKIYAHDYILSDTPAFDSVDTNKIAEIFLLADRLIGGSQTQYICAIDSTRYDIAKSNPVFASKVADFNEIHLSSKNKLFGFSYK